MRIAFLGLGLVGGSIARALHERAGPGWSAAAWTPRGTGPAIAYRAGVIGQAAPGVEAAIDGADLVVLAAPPLACLALLDALGGPLRASLADDAVITDVASTKALVVDRAAALGLRFVGGHPMAGRETAGFEAADAALFRGRPWVVVPSADDAAVARVEALAIACEALPLRLDAGEHDRLVAAISHLPLVLSAALVEAVAGTSAAPRDDWTRAAALAAGGWDGMARLARGDTRWGTGIAVTNAAAVSARLRDLRTVIEEWLALLEAPGGPDAGEIRDRLAAARTVEDRRHG